MIRVHLDLGNGQVATQDFPSDLGIVVQKKRGGLLLYKDPNFDWRKVVAHFPAHVWKYYEILPEPAVTNAQDGEYDFTIYYRTGAIKTIRASGTLAGEKLIFVDSVARCIERNTEGWVIVFRLDKDGVHIHRVNPEASKDALDNACHVGGGGALYKMAMGFNK